jgi:hypothetical protein
MAWSKSYNRRLTGDAGADADALKKYARDLDRQNPALPITRYTRAGEEEKPAGRVFGYFHFGEPTSVRLLYWVPGLEVLLIAGFAAAGWFAYRRVRRTEQQLLWAGLARETAHQLGTPVTSLIGWVEELRERAAQRPELAEPLAEMAADIGRLEKVAARFQEIGVPVRPKRGDVVPLLTKAVAYGRRRAPAKARLAFETKLPPRLVVAHSPVLLEWVVENLVKNAVDATKDLPPGKGRIVVEAREEAGGVAVAVTDNGVGVDPADLKLIFSPGYTTKEKGWGLGLSLVKRIVEEVHGGRLDVWSEKGAGATFTAFFPARPTAEDLG